MLSGTLRMQRCKLFVSGCSSRTARRECVFSTARTPRVYSKSRNRGKQSLPMRFLRFQLIRDLLAVVGRGVVAKPSEPAPISLASRDELRRPRRPSAYAAPARHGTSRTSAGLYARFQQKRVFSTSKSHERQPSSTQRHGPNEVGASLPSRRKKQPRE